MNDEHEDAHSRSSFIISFAPAFLLLPFSFFLLP